MIVLAGGVAANGYLRERLDGLRGSDRESDDLQVTNDELRRKSNRRSVIDSQKSDNISSKTCHSSLVTRHFNIFYPPPVLCTDNAAMVASRAYFSVLAGEDLAGLDLNADSSLRVGR